MREASRKNTVRPVATETLSRYTARPMREEDIPQVLEIDHEAFPTQWPYPAYAYKRELNNHLASYIVVEDQWNTWQESRQPVAKTLLQPVMQLLRRQPNDSQNPCPLCIVGFAGVWRMLDEAHLTTIAVRKTYRGLRIGELILIHVVDMSRGFGASVVTLEVRVSNVVAQSLYRKYGFKSAGIRKGYYSEDGEDALIMTTDSIESDAYLAKFKDLKAQHRKRAEQRAV